MIGLLLPLDCNLDSLKKIVTNALQPRNDPVDMTLQYQVDRGLPPVKIENDNAVEFYVELKKRDATLTKFPLCIDMNTEHVPSSERSYLGSTSEGGSNDYVDKQDLPSYIDYADKFAYSILADVDEEDDKVEAVTKTTIIEDPNVEDIEKDQLYKNRDVLKTALSLYAIKNNFQYKVHKSCMRELHLLCTDPSCKWSLRASRITKTDVFQIRRYYHIHTCSLNYHMGDHHQASSNLVADVIKGKFLNIKTIYTPGDIRKDMMDNYGVSMSYDKAYRSREKALEMIRGKPDESYAKLPKYLHMIKVTNPGSVTDFVTNSDGNFKYMYMALAASIQGWIHCKPIVVVDGTYLTSTHKGTLITACTMDANEQIFPLAFAIVDSENNLAYEWFFKNFKTTFGEREDMCIISDRHEGIIHGVEITYPAITHCACIFHLYNNLKSHYKYEVKLKRVVFFGAAKAYTL